MNNTSILVLSIILKCTSQEEKKYSKISVNKIRELLAKLYGIHVGRRWIFRILERWINKGFLNRQPRYKNDQNGLIRQDASILTFTGKGARFIDKMGFEKDSMKWE